MKEQEEKLDTETSEGDSIQEISQVDEARFQKKVDALIEEAEDMRFSRMKQKSTRGFVALNVGILSMLLGVGFFGWFFLVKVNLVMAFISIIIAIIPPILLNIWAARPLKLYLNDHKTIFMPKLANLLNGLSYHPKRGVSAKILGKLAVIPAYDRYDAEDCFMGVYKGVKVILSEARLYSKAHKKGKDPVFDGIFVLMELPEDVIEGHTIITSNDKMVKAYQKTRWKTLKKVYISISNPDWARFEVFSNKPEAAELMVGERLLKELSEASDVFNNAPVTVSMFGKKYIFIMIPNDEDMFEASSLFVPVATNQQATKSKKEIEQILEIIDVFDLYKPADK